jgi:hypothetical protein
MDSQEEEPIPPNKLWAVTIRHAFQIPFTVANRNVVDVIARKMAKDVPAASAVRVSNPPTPTLWTDSTLAPATLHVLAFLRAAFAGDLDLAISGCALVSGPTVTEEQQESTAQDDAFKVVAKRLDADANADWLLWLWQRLSQTAAKRLSNYEEWFDHNA